MELNMHEIKLILEMVNDLEAYYRSEIYVQYNDLATVGAKMINVNKIRKLLNERTKKKEPLFSRK